jgi:hypothetical protein
MISRCSEARDRTKNRSEWSSETTTDATTGGYPRTPVTSINSRRTMFTVGTPESANAIAGEVNAGAARWPRRRTLDDFRNEALLSQRSAEV